MTTIEEALSLIYQQHSNKSAHLLPIESVFGLIPTKTYHATLPNPRFNNSSMDGYGVRLVDANGCVKVIETIYAGDDKSVELREGEAVKITTGARVPESVEAIIPQEETQECDGGVKLPDQIKPQSHIRFVGEDINIGDVVVEQGERITPAHIALLASQGISHISVYRPTRAMVIATGEELKLHYQQVESHQIYNSNAPHFYSRLKELGCEVEFMAHIGDNLDEITDAIEASQYADLIITTGGVSVGDKDFVKEAFGNLGGEFIFEKIDIKPGKPTVFGKLGRSYFLGLPGNPLAAASIFELFGTAIVRTLSAQTNRYHGVITTVASETITIKKGKATLVPGHFNGTSFEASHKRAPGMVGVLHHCNAYLLASNTTQSIEQGEAVRIIPFGFGFEASAPQPLYSGALA
jgi:molybdopterin molybdotransferase